MNDVRADMWRTWKSTWDSYIKTLTMMQEQGQKMVELYLTQNEAIQTESRKWVQEGIKNAKEAQTAYIAAVEQNLKKFEDMVSKK